MDRSSGSSSSSASSSTSSEPAESDESYHFEDASFNGTEREEDGTWQHADVASPMRHTPQLVIKYKHIFATTPLLAIRGPGQFKIWPLATCR